MDVLRTLSRWGLCAVAGAVVMAVLPAGPAAAATTDVFVHLSSGEGLDAVDDFTDVSTDGGATWTDAAIVAAQAGYATISGTSWVSTDTASGVSRENATTLFRRGFGLPPGVVASTGQLCVHADNAVAVTVNGTTVITQADPADPANFSGDPSCAALATLATSGANYIDFAVQNGAGALGLDYEVNLTYTKDLDAPPTLRLPADITVGATGPSGALVQFDQPVAIDVTGATIPASCDATSGSVFPVGTTTVTCTATGTNGQQSTGTFAITVTPLAAPNGPPVLSLPADITVNAGSTSGTIVTFSVTATDDGAVPPTVTCSPPSGTRFPVGTTSVTCTALDDQGASSSGGFLVTVIGPLERACVLLQESLGITLTGRLVTTLRAAADALHQAGRDGDATTIRSLAQKVRNSGTTYVPPALRRMVVQTVQKVMARAC